VGEKLVLLNLKDLKWQKDLNQLTFSWEKFFPNEVTVYNPKTNKYVLYCRVLPNDARFDQDLWDGEQMIYKTDTATNNAEYLVLYHS